MFSLRSPTFKSLLDSKGDIHLTAYWRRDRGIGDLQAQIDETIAGAADFLNTPMTADERKRFFEPLEGLRQNTQLLQGLSESIGAFRTRNSFRVLSLPLEIEPISVVATTFHVKPLLKWMQMDRDFILIGLDGDLTSLYRGNQHSFHFTESLVFSPLTNRWYEIHTARGRTDREVRAEQTLTWMRRWLSHDQDRSPRVFVAGEPNMAAPLMRHFQKHEIQATLLSGSFHHEQALGHCVDIRSVLRAEARQTLEQALIEFQHAEDMKLGQKNIFKIAKAAAQGRVKKLIIADDFNIFGKLDGKTGGLSIHPCDLDHEDDDLLDDLAQAVLSKGGEVIVAARAEIPERHPILAIVEGPSPHQRKVRPMHWGEHLGSIPERRII